MRNFGKLVSDSIRNSKTTSAEAQQTIDWMKTVASRGAYSIRKIPFADCLNWNTDPNTGNIHHDSGKFFSIEGLAVKTNYGAKDHWEQPIINQPENGILGLIATVRSGELHFLFQAKMEPGNLGMVQLSPTVQATKSNFTGVHGGRRVTYIDYFLNPDERSVISDVLHSEQGSRFLKKRNRNMIVFSEQDFEPTENFRWLSIGEVCELLKLDNVINMDSRTVLSMLDPYVRTETQDENLRGIFNWITRLKFDYHLDAVTKPLAQVAHWNRSAGEIRGDASSFSVIAVEVKAHGREVRSWCQPLIESNSVGLLAFICRPNENDLEVLVQARVEPGNFDTLELGPTVQYLPSSVTSSIEKAAGSFLPLALTPGPGFIVHHDSLQSEEGGRFYHEQNRNLILIAPMDFCSTPPSNYRWVPLRELKFMNGLNNLLNVECRTLMACFDFREKILRNSLEKI